jgi:phosphomannomutase/phosphoglucomutase
MDTSDVVLIGRAIGTYLRRQGNTDITVGRDCRVTSDQYSEKLIQGLLATGCNVVDIGVCSTPVGYFSIRHLNKQGNVMVTASHNPPEYNGFKICSGIDSVFGDQIQVILTLIKEADFETGAGIVETYDILTPYKDYLLNNLSLARPLRVGIDAGNGTAGVTAVPIIKGLGCEVHDLYCDPDGSFPNHEADPTVLKNMQDIIALVKEKKLDVGFGYDGDGDRIGVVDAEGNLIYGDKEKNGGRAIMWKTGHSLIKQKMKLEKAELAGEMSGHIFFSDRYFGFDDAVYASCRLLEILAGTNKKISDLLADVPETVSTPEIRIECPDHIKFAVVDKVTAYFKELHDVIDIDGVRVLFPDGWGLVRASNTQPALVLRFEAVTDNRLQEIRELVETVLEDTQKQMV